ncbi:MAG: 3-phosphoshikimate 1-carboxyvinyltransferase [Planctomycetota bacterium]
MQDRREIQPARGPIVASVRPPGSKSITNRALVCAALADGESRLSGALASDDTRVMIESLNRLGIEVREEDRGRVLVVQGAGGRIPAIEADLFVGNSGTTIRFLTAMLTLGNGAFRIDGVPRMQERPIGDLADALNALGSIVRCESAGNCPPVTVHANGLAGGEAVVKGNISSQYLSALLMTAPAAAGPIHLQIDGQLVSKPYVTMTQHVMQSFGVAISIDGDMQAFTIEPARYQPCEYAIEPDASAASYFWAAAAITGGRVTVEGLSNNSLQGDVQFVRCLEAMGCRVEWGDDQITVEGASLHGVEVDMNAISDTAQTLAAVALFAEGPTRITGIAHNRHKETDRIADLATELRRVGAGVEIFDDGLEITPGKLTAAEIDTYDDHRMAMSLALVGLKQPGIFIKDPGCTGKTYPDFFADLDSLTGN